MRAEVNARRKSAPSEPQSGGDVIKLENKLEILVLHQPCILFIVWETFTPTPCLIFTSHCTLIESYLKGLTEFTISPVTSVSTWESHFVPKTFTLLYSSLPPNFLLLQTFQNSLTEQWSCTANTTTSAILSASSICHWSHSFWPQATHLTQTSCVKLWTSITTSSINNMNNHRDIPHRVCSKVTIHIQSLSVETIFFIETLHVTKKLFPLFLSSPAFAPLQALYSPLTLYPWAVNSTFFCYLLFSCVIVLVGIAKSYCYSDTSYVDSIWSVKALVYILATADHRLKFRYFIFPYLAFQSSCFFCFQLLEKFSDLIACDSWPFFFKPAPSFEVSSNQSFKLYFPLLKVLFSFLYTSLFSVNILLSLTWTYNCFLFPNFNAFLHSSKVFFILIEDFN